MIKQINFSHIIIFCIISHLDLDQITPQILTQKILKESIEGFIPLSTQQIKILKK